VRVLLAGVSTRAAAASAARAGFEVTALDAFADFDQHPSVDARSLGGRFSPDAAARCAQEIACDAVAYGSSFENDPDAVALLANGRALWGNPSDVLRRVRDPKLLSQTLRRRGFAAPEVLDECPISQSPRTWLLKRLASGGGHGVREWHRGVDVERGSYLQEFVDGAPCSIVFVAAHGRVVPLGFCRQLIGDDAFGSSGYRYCGNILTAAGEDDEAIETACALAAAVCEEFALVGLNGIDLIAKDRVPYAIELNPRWCASMEVLERAYGASVFAMHATACRDGALPDFDLARARRQARTTGKAVVFARRDVNAGDTRAWLTDFEPGGLHDVPRPGTRIHVGQPVCTVVAAGRDSAECRAELVRLAQRVYECIEKESQDTLG
jgi:predicted ATP-grasp superfamily ATP-dependent carboligase